LSELSRTIPADVKRAVRQHCGFGCVLCGASIYEYDHFDPPFVLAERHDPEGITLLCPTHHSEKTRGVLPLEAVRRANASPAALQNGETTVSRPYFDHIPSLLLGGGILIENTPVPLEIDGVPLIKFAEPEEGSKVARIFATITSENGEHLLSIEDNEWIVRSGVWDYEWVGQRMTIRDDSGAVSLQIVVYPPKLIEIDRLRFKRGGFDVIVTRTELRVNGGTFVNCVSSDCPVGMALGKSSARAGGIHISASLGN
jgi:hypothetical protein